MASDEEILKLWDALPKKLKKDEAILRLYRQAEENGKQACLTAMEKELLSDSTLTSALQPFGLARKGRAGIITVKAILREALHVAAEKAKPQD